MLFPYKYVPHKMEKMQKFINFIFYQVWCRAHKTGTFCLELFDANPDLKEVMESFYYSDTKGADFFYSHVERIYGFFAQLSRADIKQFKRWYQGNNDIQKVCNNDSATDIVRYSNTPLRHKALFDQLATFFKGLYDNLDIAALKKKISGIDDHYQVFMTANESGKCPFCGIGDIKGLHRSKREAYDHYLPKALYPFNSINFRNLAPACHECNSTYKMSKDPVSTAAGRRKTFYPYANSCSNIDVSIKLCKSDVDHLTPDDIQLTFGPLELSEEIETWKDIYGIEERYKAKCCSNNDGKYWLTQILDEWQEDSRSPADFMNMLNRQATRNPFAESNFLKKAFLEGCGRAGLFNTDAGKA